MTKIALLGAGGKMGVRLATNLMGSRFEVDHVEVSEEGRQRLKSAVGVDCVDQDQALAGADVVVMAVPDRLIGKITHSIVDKVRPGRCTSRWRDARPSGRHILRHASMPSVDLQ
jgi:predicted dinucleotide-binding enzyme